jgi:flagellar basal body-associated protein FliL
MRGLSGSTQVLFAAVLFACALAGCSSKTSFKYDQLDVNSVEEELSEFSLGKYQIPIPVADERHDEAASRRNRFQFDFELYAVVSPKEESHIADVWDRHEGVIRDRVINICRSASVEELREPELATLKSRLTDVLALQLGEKRLRQLLIIDIVSQEL